MVAKTQFAITGEDTRYFLNGALFILRADSMSLVATDGHRLALVIAAREGWRANKVEAEDRVILPRKTLARARSAARRRRRRHSVRAGREPSVLRIGGRVLISRMIDGQFPAFERVIPKTTISAWTSIATG